MALFDSKTALNHAIRYLADAAQKRAAGGWIPPKERERQQRDAMRQEQQQARQVEKQQKEAARAEEKQQKLLSKQYPTHYMPNVGRQVMADGGVPESGDHPRWIPTRLPKIEKNRAPNQIVDYETARNAPGGYFSKNIAHIRDYVNIPKDVAKNATDDELAEHFINHIKENLLDLHDSVPEEIRARSQKWYDGARAITDRLSAQYNLPDHSVAGALAALSPQMDWFKNVSLAHRVIDIMSNHHDKPFDDKMLSKFSELTELAKKPEYTALAQMLHGKSMTDIDNLGLPEKERVAAKALWLRTHDETYGDRRHHLVTPEGELGEYVTSASGAPKGTGWGSFNEIGKAIKAIELKDDPDAISPLMGMKHKVRNFYNNILAPNSTKGDVTIDTHAVAAGLYRPLSGNSLEVAHNLGTSPPPGMKGAADSATVGLSGTYPIFAEAYRRAAAERNILPRQMQSITWEAVRSLYPDTFKRGKKIQDIDNIWQQHKNGLIDQSQAREMSREIALGKGNQIPPPSWFGAGLFSGAGGPNAPSQNTGEQGIVSGLGISGQQAGEVDARGRDGFAAGPSQEDQVKFARGGYVDGGSPSIGERINEYAETLPTAEENIETLKNLGRNVGESALDFGKRIYSGFEKMAERALERPPAPTVRAGERPVYVEPKREVQPQRLYVLPDGRRASGAELEMHNEMMRERFEEQHAMPRVVQENMPPPNRPAPTRAPMRERLERQEQQANVNRPVVMPERERFEWPQAYKDIMSDEPQMEWTKGMTPREQPAPAPVQTAEGSIFSSRGSDGRESGIQMGGGSNSSGPLEVSVTKTITGPKDVYLGTGDNPNPFHSHQTMVAPAPEYEGQVVPIPDTPADRMGEHHLPRLIWPLHELKNKEGYKAKQGLEDYNPPASAIGERFPTKEDVDFYRNVDAYYGRPEAGYLQQGARGSYYDDLTEMTSRKGGYRREMTPQESDAFKAAYIAAQRNPIAALGFRPEEFDFSGDPIPQTTAGMVSSPQSRIYADLKFPSVAVHEAIHRGLVEIRNEDYNAYQAKTGNLLQEMNDLAKQPYSPEKSKRFFEISDELDALRKQPTDPDIFPASQIGDAEGKEDEQEMFVRSLMYKMFGPVEAYEMERQLVNGDVIKAYPPEKLDRFMIDNADRIGRLEQRAMKMLQERQREGGPRASGGAVRREYALGGNPADREGGGYGTGNIGGGSPISSGGSMAEARAADRESVSGYSASSGGDSGRDRSISFDSDRSSGEDRGPGLGFDGAEVMSPLRGISNGVPMFAPARSQEQMLRALGVEGDVDNSGLPTALRPGGNIGAALAKEALTPDLTTANSPLASGIPSYNREALDAMSDSMRSGQQAARDASYERSVIGPTTPQINVPNAGDLYGATNAPLAFNQVPSGMLGQPEYGTTKFGDQPMQSGFPAQQKSATSQPITQPARPISPTPFSSFPQDVQNSMIPNRPDSDFGQTLIDPTGKYTNQALDQMKVAGDATTMLNSPTLAGSFVRAFTPTPTPATPQQQASIERMYQRDLNSGVPSNFATPEGMAQRYGAPGATPLAHPGQTSDAYLSAGPSASTGRQDMPVSTALTQSQGAGSADSSPMSIRQNFEKAFSEARDKGLQVFTWTNPVTGQSATYTTALGRKAGGRVPSLKEPDQWIAETEKPRSVAKTTKPRKPSKMSGTAIVERALMLSSRKS